MNERVIYILKRAAWTFCESMLAFYTAGQSLSQIDWKLALSVSTAAFIFSIIKSFVTGIPEEQNNEE